jgi:prepilin signal peptidase PulO-like enzyme (type II secretory pathway)
MTDALAGSLWGAALAAVAGAVLGGCLSAAVRRWFAATNEPAGAAAGPFGMAAGVVVAVALWWWEVRLYGQIPYGLKAAAGSASGAAIAWRCFAHMVLFWLLAAATWIDMRQRVIPDWITIPGVLAGLIVAWGFPDALLPVAVEVPRSFAAPAVEPDVLGFLGGLRTARGPEWLGSQPHLPGLLLVASLFAAWWAICTEPDGRTERWPGPRTWLLFVGLAALLGAWLVGGERFRALESALVGMAVSGGIVWATRAGASRALGREAMGLGDVTLMAMVGAWLGWQACVLTFFLATFLGLTHGLFQLVRHRESELPFGPSLCLAAALVVVAWRPLWQAVAIHFEDPARLVAVVVAVVLLTAITLFAWRLLRDRLAT